MTIYAYSNDLITSEFDGVATFKLQLNAPSSSAITINYYTISESATKSRYGELFADYTDTNGQLIFNPGETIKEVPIGIYQDTYAENAPTRFKGGRPEYTESFAIGFYVFGNQDVKLSKTTYQAIVFDNDTKPGTPTIDASGVVVDEGSGVAYYTLKLDRPSTQIVQVNYRTQDNTATSGIDYIESAGTLQFLPGEITKTIPINIINDLLMEQTEHFRVILSDNINSNLGSSYGVIIGPSDQSYATRPNIGVNNSKASENDGYISFIVALSAPSSQLIEVNYTTRNGSAIGSSGSSGDYVDTGGRLNFAPGETVKTIIVPLNQDSAEENDEFFYLNINSSSNVNFVSTFGTGTITNAPPPDLNYITTPPLPSPTATPYTPYSFDENYYLKQYPDVVNAVNSGLFASGLQHYVLYGAKEHRNPNKLFDEYSYINNNPDIMLSISKGALFSGIQHYELFGKSESRTPNAGVVFDENAYLENYPDVKNAVLASVFISGWDHYVKFGFNEGRSTNKNTNDINSELSFESGNSIDVIGAFSASQNDFIII